MGVSFPKSETDYELFTCAKAMQIQLVLIWSADGSMGYDTGPEGSMADNIM